MKIQSSGASPNKKNNSGKDTHSSASGRRSKGKTTMTRRQFLVRGAATVIGAGLLTSGYAWQGEPNWIQVTKLKLSFKDIPSAFQA